MKKFLHLIPLAILCLVLVLLLPNQASAASESDLTFTLNADGQSYSVTDCSTFASGSLTIPATYNDKPVTGIGDSAFSWCDSLTGITIPDSVTSIGNYAFCRCTSLTSVTIPDSVTSIGASAFYNCTSLTSVTIPDSVTGIGDGAFYDCTSLTSITIPDSVTGIGDNAFEYCTSLTSVTIPDSVTSIGDNAFYYCDSLTGIWVDEKNTAYSNDEYGVLFNKDKTELIQAPAKNIAGAYTIPDSVTSIGDWAFRCCTSLTSVTIPDSVTSIGSSAFNSCNSLISVTIGDSVTSIGNYAFSRCTSLTSVTIGDSVTGIGENAFSWCDSLTSVTIPDSVTGIGYQAFNFCTSLTDVYITDPNAWCKIAFGDSYSNPMYYGKGHILDANGDEITNLVLDSSVTKIPSGAFQNCTNLTSVTIPGSVTSIGSYAFEKCISLIDVYYNGSPQQWSTISFGSGNEQLTNANIVFNPAYLLQYEVEDGYVTITGMPTTATGSLAIPATIDGYPVTAIGNRAFYNCRELKKVIIPDSVTSIGNAAFGWCLGLTEITVPDSVESIGYSAFCNCFNLTSFRVPANITMVSNSMLEGCSGLTEVILPDGLQSIGYYAFSGCESLENISIPATVTDIQNSAFAKCYSLRSVTIPNGITDIDYSVFEACQSLEMVILPSSVSTINMYAFDGCTSLEEVYYKGSRSQWKNLSVGSRNNALLAANLHCNPVELQAEDALLVTEDGLADNVFVEAGQVLDLNGHILTADNLASFGQIIDSVGGGGLIVANLEMVDNNWLPVKDSDGCYRFYEYGVDNLGTKENTDRITFGFTLNFRDAAAYTTLLESDDVQVAVTLAVGDKVQTYAFSKVLIQRYLELQNKYPQLRPYLKLEVTGLGSLTDGTVITVTPTIVALDGKINKIGANMNYTA